jgi:hypothetical protein
MGYQFKSNSEHTCLVKMVDLTILKSVEVEVEKIFKQQLQRATYK